MIRTVIITGRPGSGKGTQGKHLAEARGWMHFSTGEQFRLLREEESALGARVREVYDSGRLMPDWFATYLFQRAAFGLSPEAGIVCEGYPRSLAQAQAFDEIAAWLERPYTVIDLEVPDEEVTRRMLNRAQNDFRPDSASEEQIQVRLAAYHEHTAPVLEFFKAKGILHSIDGTQAPEDVERALADALQ